MDLFRPFQQGAEGATKGGTGLGLAIAKRLVELMQGEIGFESEQGKGSRFWFTVPLTAAEQTPNVQRSTFNVQQPVKLAAGCSIKALVVDDVPENRDVLARLLGGLGCEVREAESGERTLSVAKADPPDIVFLDIRMPGMDGLEVARQIRSPKSEIRNVKLVSLSASALAHEQQHYRDAGFDDFIAKPFRFERICECLARLLNAQFEYAADVQTIKSVGPMELPEALPAEILTRLREAAERRSVTRLEKCFEELEQSGEPGQTAAANHLRRLVAHGDLNGVSSFLAKVRAAKLSRWKRRS